MTSSGNTQALALAKLIYETTGKIVQEYNSAGQSLPSLDSTDPGPLDAPGKISAELARHVRIIEGACAQLSIMVNRPGYVIINKGCNFIEVSCLNVVIDAKVADHLLDKPDGLHINELATKSGLDANKLGRVLRLLATAHCFREVSPDVFANNRISVQLCTDNPAGCYAGLLADESLTAGGYLSETISSPEFGSSLSSDHTAFRRAHGTSVFGFYSRPANINRHDRFTRGMIGFAEMNGKLSIPRAMPWGSAPESSTICDIGGGNGHITLELAEQYPNLRVIIQDLPNVIEQAKQFWNKNFPEAIQTQRVQFIEHDFFKDTPSPNCKFYYMRHILHDWPDSDCLKILSNIRKVMSPDSLLLINEFVLQPASRESRTMEKDIDQAPEPMLSNYGQGRIQPYQLDILMMLMLNSKERTLREFISLTKQAGFNFEKVVDCGEMRILEFSAN